MKVLSATWLDTMAVGRIVDWPFRNYSDDTIVLPVLEWKVKPSEARQLISLDVTSESDPYVMADPLLQFGHGLQLQLRSICLSK